MNTNAIITYCSPECAEQHAGDVAIMVRSCAKVDAAKFVLTQGLGSAAALFRDAGFVEWRVPDPPHKRHWDGHDQGLNFVRWDATIDLLSGSDWELALTLDARDVVIQRDPFPMIERGLTVCGDGFIIGSFPWCIKDQNAECKVPGMLSWQLVNGAMFGGSPRSIVEWLRMLRNRMDVSTAGASDQAIVNHLWYVYGVHKPYWRMSDHRQSLLYFCGFPTKMVKGHRTTAKWINGAVCNSDGDPYAIVHQFDRSIFADAIRSAAHEMAT